MLTTKKVRGYLLKVEEAPATFEGLLQLAQQHNELGEDELVKALSASAVNNEYQHPAAERFVMFHAEFICPKWYDMSLTEVLKSTEYNVKDASSVVKEAKKAFADECGHAVGSEKWQQCVDDGDCEYLFNLSQAQKCWDEEVLVFSGLGKKPKKVSIAEKAIWSDRVVTVKGFFANGQTAEQIVSLMSGVWGGAEAVEAFVERVEEQVSKEAEAE